MLLINIATYIYIIQIESNIWKNQINGKIISFQIVPLLKSIYNESKDLMILKNNNDVNIELHKVKVIT